MKFLPQNKFRRFFTILMLFVFIGLISFVAWESFLKKKFGGPRWTLETVFPTTEDTAFLIWKHRKRGEYLYRYKLGDGELWEMKLPGKIAMIHDYEGMVFDGGLLALNLIKEDQHSLNRIFVVSTARDCVATIFFPDTTGEHLIPEIHLQENALAVSYRREEGCVTHGFDAGTGKKIFTLEDECEVCLMPNAILSKQYFSRGDSLRLRKFSDGKIERIAAGGLISGGKGLYESDTVRNRFLVWNHISSGTVGDSFVLFSQAQNTPEMRRSINQFDQFFMEVFEGRRIPYEYVIKASGYEHFIRMRLKTQEYDPPYPIDTAEHLIMPDISLCWDPFPEKYDPALRENHILSGKLPRYLPAVRRLSDVIHDSLRMAYLDLDSFRLEETSTLIPEWYFADDLNIYGHEGHAYGISEKDGKMIFIKFSDEAPKVEKAIGFQNIEGLNFRNHSFHSFKEGRFFLQGNYHWAVIDLKTLEPIFETRSTISYPDMTDSVNIWLGTHSARVDDASLSTSTGPKFD